MEVNPALCIAQSQGPGFVHAFDQTAYGIPIRELQADKLAGICIESFPFCAQSGKAIAPKHFHDPMHFDEAIGKQSIAAHAHPDLVEIDHGLIDTVPLRPTNPDIQPHAGDSISHAMHIPLYFDQDTRQLPVANQNIVRPLEPGCMRAVTIDCSRNRKPYSQTQAGHGLQAALEAPQYRKHQPAAWRRMPRPATATAAGLLVLGHDDMTIGQTRLCLGHQQPVSRVDTVEHMHLICSRRFTQMPNNLARIQPVDRIRQTVASSAHGMDTHPQPFGLRQHIEHARARQAEFMRQCLPGMKSPIGQTAQNREKIFMKPGIHSGILHAEDGCPFSSSSIES
ncbi:MAG: hypothetical protein ABT21_10550 [Thiobacillus sp. SCN 65-179]|nr:MAG: hypothetical protein ABT21_10550 [Thiobacillus sp. SCN 65-179]